MRIWGWRGTNGKQALGYIHLTHFHLRNLPVVGGPVKVHRLLYVKPHCPGVISRVFLGSKAGRNLMVGYITLYFLYFICYHIAQLGNPGTTEFPTARTLAILSSFFNEKLEIDTLSEHLETHVSDITGVFWFHPLPHGWFVENHPGIWFHWFSGQVFPLLLTEDRNSSLTHTHTQPRTKQTKMCHRWQWGRQILYFRGFQDCHLLIVGMENNE